MSVNSGYSIGSCERDIRVLSLEASASAGKHPAQTEGASWNGRSVQTFVPVTQLEKALSVRLNEVFLPELAGLVMGYLILPNEEILKKLVSEVTNAPSVVLYRYSDETIKRVQKLINKIIEDPIFKRDPGAYVQERNAKQENNREDLEGSDQDLRDQDIAYDYITKFLQKNQILPVSDRIIADPSKTVSEVLIESAGQDQGVCCYFRSKRNDCHEVCRAPIGLDSTVTCLGEYAGLIVRRKRNEMLRWIGIVAKKQDFQNNPVNYMERWNEAKETWLEEYLAHVYIKEHLQERQILDPDFRMSPFKPHPQLPAQK
jgi:hypothetical protein